MVHVAPPADRKLSAWVPNPPPPPPAHGLQTVAGKAAPADRKLSAWVPNPPPPGKVPVVVPPRSHCKALPFMILTCSCFVFSRDGTCGSWTLRFKSCEAAVGEIVPGKMPVVGRKDELRSRLTCCWESKSKTSMCFRGWACRSNMLWVEERRWSRRWRRMRATLRRHGCRTRAARAARRAARRRWPGGRGDGGVQYGGGGRGAVTMAVDACTQGEGASPA